MSNRLTANPQHLRHLQDEARRTGVLAVDTEFVWERTFYPRLGVVQLAASATEVVLVDAPALEAPSVLRELFTDPTVEKVFHDASTDVDILRRAYGVTCTPLFDVRLGAGFCGAPATLSLAALLERALDIELAKTETRTNWLRRPLSPEQISYAVDDVKHLPALRDWVLSAAEGLGNATRMREEMDALAIAHSTDGDDARERYRRIRGGGALRPRRRAVLRELAAWREGEARRADRPRGWILHDKVLLAIARALPKQKDKLAACRVPGKTVRRHGDHILGVVEAALAMPREEWPRAPRRIGDRGRRKKWEDRIMGEARERGAELGIDSCLIATRADVSALVSAIYVGQPSDSLLLQGWRREILGRVVDACGEALEGAEP